MRARHLAIFVALAACQHDSPAGALLIDWDFAQMEQSPPPVPKHPPQNVASDQDWPGKNGTLKLHFEVEIGDLAGTDGTHWDWPRHVRITLAAPAHVALPKVQCMAAPPGNILDGGVLVHPVGVTGVPKGMVGCFVSGKDPADDYVYNIDGEGKITREVTKH